MSEKRKDSKGRVLRTGESQRKDGKYMYRYTDISGERRSVYSWKLVNTDRAPEGTRCTVALRDMEKQIERDLDDKIDLYTAESITVNKLFERFLEVRIDLKTTTRCNYIALYNKHVKDSLGYKKVKNIKFSDIQKFYTGLSNDLGLGQSTITSIHSILCQLFESAVMDNIIRINPTKNALKNAKKLIQPEDNKRHALTIEEQERLVNYVYGEKQFVSYAPLITVLLGTGMRIGEALGLRWCDCDFNTNTINVNHAIMYKPNESGGYEYRISEPKTKAGIRTIPMFEDVRKALLKERFKKSNPSLEPFEVNGYSDFIFVNSRGKVYTPAFIFDTIQSIVYNYNKDETRLAAEENRTPCYLPKMSAHILRHTFCTRICENEQNIKVIQDIMGHKNIRTTMDVYNEATESTKRNSFKKLEGKLKLA